MIFVNGTEINDKTFPDGTLSLKMTPTTKDVFIVWKYDNDREMAVIYFITKYFNNLGASMRLSLPYIPNARMDRVKKPEEMFTLKYFAEFINSLGFQEVRVLDPHSNVSTALIDRVKVDTPMNYIWDVWTDITRRETNDYCTQENRELTMENLVMFYPDEGAMKRYSEMITHPYAFGMKKRDWETGDIKGLDVIGTDNIKDKTILIVDDICSKGGTFYHSAKALKEAGAGDIYLYISHCENTIFEGELLTTDFIKHIYTTDTIYRGEHDKITVIKDRAF